MNGSTRAERGSAAAELAIILPVLSLLVFGTIQFGIAYNREQAMEAAAREAARLASIGADVTAITARVDEALPFSVSAADVDIEVRRYAEDEDAGDFDGGTAVSSGEPCDGEIGSHTVRVDIAVTRNLERYELAIPFWPGRGELQFPAFGIFRCEVTP